MWSIVHMCPCCNFHLTHHPSSLEVLGFKFELGAFVFDLQVWVENTSFGRCPLFFRERYKREKYAEKMSIYSDVFSVLTHGTDLYYIDLFWKAVYTVYGSRTINASGAIFLNVHHKWGTSQARALFKTGHSLFNAGAFASSSR